MKTELTPEVAAALDVWRQFRREQPHAIMGTEGILADAFAALHPPEPPELQPGVYRAVRVYRDEEHDCYLFVSECDSRVSIDVDDGLCLKSIDDELEGDVFANIRRIDDSAAWDNWATREWPKGSIGVLLRNNGWDKAADELEALIGGET